MTIRKPEPKAAVAMLRAAFQDAGAQVQTKVAYDLLARLDGYKNWAHYQAENRRKSTPPPALEQRLGRTEEEVAHWPVWVFYTAWVDGEEEFFVLPFGTRIEDVLDSYGPDASLGTPDTPEQIPSDEERRQSFVVRKLACWYPRADRYGFPRQANEREVADWIDDELGWNYLSNAQGDSLVEVVPTDTGDDSIGTYALEVSVSPARHELLLACFGPASGDGCFVERGREPAFRAGPFTVSLAELGDDEEFLWADVRVRLGKEFEDATVSTMSWVPVSASDSEREVFVREVATFLNENVPDTGKLNLRAFENAFLRAVQGGVDTAEKREGVQEYLQRALSEK